MYLPYFTRETCSNFKLSLFTVQLSGTEAYAVEGPAAMQYANNFNLVGSNTVKQDMALNG